MRFEYEFGDIADENNDLVAKVEQHQHGALLAAAPELLAALEAMLDAPDDDSRYNAALDARAAIARAKGGGRKIKIRLTPIRM